MDACRSGATSVCAAARSSRRGIAMPEVFARPAAAAMWQVALGDVPQPAALAALPDAVYHLGWGISWRTAGRTTCSTVGSCAFSTVQGCCTGVFDLGIGWMKVAEAATVLTLPADRLSAGTWVMTSAFLPYQGKAPPRSSAWSPASMKLSAETRRFCAKWVARHDRHLLQRQRR
jgi:hypothetical protein